MPALVAGIRAFHALRRFKDVDHRDSPAKAARFLRAGCGGPVMTAESETANGPP
jgi:hypothetical protein